MNTTEFVSIGPYCDAAEIIKQCGLRNHSYPFDYIFSSLEMVKHAIDDRFQMFLDKQYLKYSSYHATFHLFYCKFLDTEILRRHHIAHGVPEIAKNLHNREVFWHYDESTYEAFVRRCKRFLDLISSSKRVVLVYYNCYTDEIADLVEFSKSFLTHPNVFVVGIFRNRNEKNTILYESSNCKIYQNFDNIFENVQETLKNKTQIEPQ